MTIIEQRVTLAKETNIDERTPYLTIQHTIDVFRNRISWYFVLMINKDTTTRKKILITKSKEEVKIWIDLNGYKLTDKIVIYDKGLRNIQYEMFKLERI